MVSAQPRTHSGKTNVQNSLGFWDTNGASSLGQMTTLRDNQQKKRTCQIVDFADLADHRVKLKEGQTGNKYLDLARALKKLWNINATVIPIVIGACDTVTKRLVQGR